ncbi:LOW QUALITY PROTEIN: stonustoxin subunit beta-like [Gymnodraco acuticeps]|uniref:LOW QUALITY PROTEIN: stonustoxin subunit beta-like n=1 Tax=Gymnodraco acuticeps TaxID=8218 RepID=A0A6P8SQF1_GYMAC|nr:LOW QUALITY PROTEIN: stonustoxin subunit beta-like [Gymnodraco acuticeps]
MASDHIEVAALGRPFTLGMLYDARRDTLIPGLTLWNPETLKVKQTRQQGSTFVMSASDSTESKSTLLDIDASLKASFMSGLIKVGGSAKYLNDEKKFKNQSRVTCQYKATTNFQQLSVTQLKVMSQEQRDLIKNGLATHVVTGILYGANAFFVFDSEKLEASQVQKTEGSMQAVIKMIPSLNIEGKVKLKLTAAEKALTEKLSCEFHGDFILESNPATFQAAVQTYVELPHLLGTDGEKAVPVKVWLMPLKLFEPAATGVRTDISIELVRKAQEALEELREAKMRCNDSLQDKVVESFPEVRKDLSTFQNLCGYYKTNLQQAMAEKLPSIREGKEKESSLEKVFEDRHKSPFNHEKLNKWLDHKERELNIIKSFVDTMEGVKIVLNQKELDREVLASGVEDVLCFVFTSMRKGDSYLDEMADFLKSPKLGSTHEEEWYYSMKLLNTMREKATFLQGASKGLKNNSKFCFLITAKTNPKYKGASIYHYKKGQPVNEDFQRPKPPSVETIKHKRDLIWYACDLHLDPNTAHKKLTLSHGNKKATYGKDQKYPSHPHRFGKQRQVLCKERLSGCHYWEVEWSTSGKESVFAAVTYKGADGNKSDTKRFGQDSKSWCFGKENHIRAYHDSKRVLDATHLPGDFSRFGVYLDWPAGTLSFYRVSSNTLTHLYTFRTKFTDPLVPGLFAYHNSNYAYLCPVEL